MSERSPVLNLPSFFSSAPAIRKEREIKECIPQVTAAHNPKPPRFSDNMDDLRQIVELRPDPVPNLIQLFASVLVRIKGAADTIVIVPRCLFNHFFQR